MAEKRGDTIYTSSALGQRADSQGASVSEASIKYVLQGMGRHVVIPFLTQNIDNGDTFTLHDGTTYFAPSMAIITAAWQPIDSSDLVVPVIDSDEQGITFTSTGDNHNGYLHLWVTG